MIDNYSVGDVFYSFGLRKFGGRIWDLNFSRVRIVKINSKSVRINRLDDNSGRGNEWSMSIVKFDNDFLPKCFIDLDSAVRKYVVPLRKVSLQADKMLDGFTSLHPDYEWYVYTRDILNDFYELCSGGKFTIESYNLLKKKYAVYENKLLQKVFS